MPGFDPKQPRDPEGKWIDAAIAALPKGKKIGIHGHVVDNIPSKGYRVRLKGVGSQHYQKPEHAAQAVRSGRHFTPESQKAAEASQEAAFRKMVAPPKPTSLPPPTEHPMAPSRPPGSAHEFGQWAQQTAARKATAPARTLEEERASHLKIQFQQARNRVRNARGPTAMQSAERSKADAERQLREMGYRLAGDNQTWQKIPGAPTVPPSTPRTIQGTSGTIHTRSMPVTTGTPKPEPQGVKVSIPAISGGNYSAHYATTGFGTGGKPNIEIWHPTEGHIATLQYNETKHQVLAKGRNYAVGSRTTKGYTYTLVHPEVLAHARAQRQEAVRSNAAYLPSSRPGSMMEDKLGYQAEEAIAQHEQYLARARASAPNPRTGPPPTGSPMAPTPSAPKQRQNGGQSALGANYGHVTATGVSPVNPGYNPTLSDKELDAAIRRAREIGSPMLSMYLKIKEARQNKKVVSGGFGQQLRNQKRQNWVRQGV